MSDKIEELIKEIAVIHGIAVSRGDPIFVLQTINNRLLQDSAAALDGQLDQLKEELESLSLRWGSDATGKAEKILNAALAASKSAMSQIMQEEAKRAAATLRAEVDSALTALGGPIQDAERIGRLNIVAAGITLAAAAIALWASFG